MAMQKVHLPCVYFEKPGFQIRVKQDIEAVELEAMLIIDYHALNALQTANDNILDIIKRLADFLLSIPNSNIQFGNLSQFVT